MEILGLAVAILFHHAFSLLLMVIFIRSNVELNEAIVPLDRECLAIVGEYVAIAVPNIFILMASWW